MLNQISPTYLQFTTNNDMIINSQYQLANIFSIIIDSINPSSYTYTFNQKNPSTIEIRIAYSQSFIYRQLNLQVNQPSAITDSTGAYLDLNSYSTQIQMVIIYSSAEKTIQDIIPYFVWGFFVVFIGITISFLFMKVDTVSIWNILEFFQICGVLNYLNIFQTLLKSQNTEESQVNAQSQLQEQLVNYNDKSIVEDSQQNSSFVYEQKQMFQTQQEQKNIELATTQPVQQQNFNDLNTVQSQLIDSPQKLVNQPTSNNANTSQFSNNYQSLNKSQPNQIQFQAQISLNNSSALQQPSDFIFSSHQNGNILNNQSDQEQNQNIRFSNKTSTFSAENNQRNQQ
ncbi:hypothetical protein ABPG72_007013 [Tetrahymena utriculariae]